MDTSMITDDTLKEIILGVLNEQGEKYWVKSITRDSRLKLQGTVIEVENIENMRGGEISRIIANKFSFATEGELEPYIAKINKAYIEKLSTVSKDFKVFYDTSMLKIEQKTNEFRLRLVEYFYENGYVKNDIKGIFKGTGLDELREKIARRKHAEYIAPIENHILRDNYIQPGVIYLADLNPNLKGEIGGVRPVLIAAKNSDFIVVLPISDSDQTGESRNVFKLDVASDVENALSENSKICVDCVRAVHKSRILHKIVKLKDETFTKVMGELSNFIIGPQKTSDEVQEFFAALDDPNYMIFNEQEEQELREEENKPEVETAETDKNNDERISPKRQDGITQPQPTQDKNFSMANVVEHINERDVFEAKNPKVYYTPKKQAYQPQEFMLTDEEAWEIASQQVDEEKARGTKMIFEDPQISGNGTLRDGVVVSFNSASPAPHKRRPLIEYIFNAFSVDVIIDGRVFKQYSPLRDKLVKKLQQKYSQYAPKFIEQAINFHHLGYAKYNCVLQDVCNRLKHDLALVGKESYDLEGLVTYGLTAYKYSDLGDLKDEKQI